MTRSTGKRDTNHKAIKDALRMVPGMVVVDVADHRDFGADLIVRWRNDPPVFVEIKSDGKAALTDSEKRLRDTMTPYWIRANRVEDVLEAFGLGER